MQEIDGTILIERWQAGDELAATELYRRYSGRILALASHNLPSALKAKYDEDDAANSAFRSLMIGARNKKFEFANDEAIWKVLITITLNKIRNRLRHATAQKRNMNLEMDNSDDWFISALSQTPGPNDTMEFVEVVEALEANLSEPSLSPNVLAVFRLRLEGYTAIEIAKEINQTTRSVNRHLERIRKRLEEFSNNPYETVADE